MGDAKATLAELATLESSSPDLKGSRLSCDTAIHVATGDLPAAELPGVGSAS